LTGIGANDHHAQVHAINGADHTGSLAWADINKTISSIADITTRSHTALSDIGTNTHATIDTHLGAAAPHSGHEVTSAKGAASGYCPLDAGSLVPDANIPSAICRDSELATHAGLTTGVHGAGASTLATVVDISTHSGLTTGIHGVGASTIASIADITPHAALPTGIHGVGASTVASVANISTHAALTTGVHGAGASTLATVANITTHAALTASVHNFDASGNAPPQAHVHATGDITSGIFAVLRGGTGQSTEQAAINALTAVAGATNEHVLTKDTATGNAIFKAAAGGGVTDHGALTGLLDDDHTQYALLAGRGTGQTLIGGVNTTNSLTLKPNSVDGTGYLKLDGEVDLRDSLTSLAAFSTYNCVKFDSSIATAGTLATLSAFNFAPTVSITHSSFSYFPVNLGGTFTFGLGHGSNTNNMVYVNPLFDTGAAAITAIGMPKAFVDNTTLRSSHTTATYLGTFATVYAAPTFNATAAGTQFLNANFRGVYDAPSYIAGTGINNLFTRYGYYFTNPLSSGAGINYQYGSVGLYVENQTLTNLTNRVCAVESAMNANSVLHYNLFCNGTAPSAHLGPFVVGAAAQPTNASTGLEVQSTTKAFLAPRMTTTQKNALTPVNGMQVYDSTLNRMQGYINGAWGSMGPTPTSYSHYRGGNTVGSTNDNIVCYSTLVSAAGSALTYTSDATNGDYWTVNISGLYSICALELGIVGSPICEVCVGASRSNTMGGADTMARSYSIGGYVTQAPSWIGYITSGQVIFIRSDVAPGGNAYSNQVSIAHIW